MICYVCEMIINILMDIFAKNREYNLTMNRTLLNLKNVN